MPDITVALDEGGANDVFGTAISLIPPQTKTGSGSLGPFTASYTASTTFSPGTVDLIAPATIRIVDFRADWSVNFSFSVDLSSILPDFCIPQVCVDIPCVGRVCTPRICVDWPTITIPISFSDFVSATADFGIAITHTGSVWRVEVVVQNVSKLQFGPTTFTLLAVIAAAVTPILLAIPFIGPFLAIAIDAILAVIGVAGITGFLGPIISPFVSGLRIKVYEQPEHFQALGAAGPNDPAVFINLDAVDARVISDGEDEFVLTVDIS